MKMMIMKIAYISDLHLGRPYNEKFIRDYMACDIDANVLIVAGDVCNNIDNILDFDIGRCKLKIVNEFIDWCDKKFEKTIIVPGNHEFYCGAEMNTFINGCAFDITSNIHLVSNSVCNIGNVKFICTPLWSEVDEKNYFDVNIHMTDCKYIKYDGNLLTAQRFSEVHDICKKFVERALEENAGENVIVVSHHCPVAEQCYNPIYANSALNSAFHANDMEDIIEKYAPKFWIYGHTHYNTDYEFKNGTKLVSNQIGYDLVESENFNNNKLIII